VLRSLERRAINRNRAQSVRAELVEGQLFLSALPTEERCFDKLRTNDDGVSRIKHMPLRILMTLDCPLGHCERSEAIQSGYRTLWIAARLRRSQ
jgi:hypothetical protein